MIILIQIIIFLSYTSYIVFRYGVQHSISETYYTLGKAGKLFTLVFCFGLGIPQLFYGNWAFFLSGAFLCFVGAATEFKSKDKIITVIHNTGATGGIVFGLLGLALEGIWWPAIPLVAGIYPLLKVENRTWWIECLAFVVIIAGLLTK